MKVSSSLQNLIIRSLAETATVEIMETLVKELVPNYDLWKRTGFPLNIPIPNRDAARQICRDMINLEILPHFISLLIEINTRGYFGREIKISYLREIIREIYEHGFIFDNVNRILVEDPNIRRTRNWGVLRISKEYVLTFLRLDIVGNSELVRKYPEEVVTATYQDLLEIVERSIEKRNGRIWNWEGDGGLVAFYFSNKNKLAVLSGMEILHELFLYNQMKCRLEHPLGVRLAIHTGYCDYTENVEDLNKNETIKAVIDIESRFTNPNTLTASLNIHSSLDGELAKNFITITGERGMKYFNYHMKWEQ